MKYFVPTILTFFLIMSCSDSDEPTVIPPEQFSLPTLTTAAITDITDVSANSGGNISVDGGAAVTARGVCWSTSSGPTIADSKTSNASGIGEFSSTLEGLTPQTTYYVRSYATNSEGTAYGNELSFMTTEQTFEQKIFDGDVILKNQNELDEFISEEYTEVTGYLNIVGIEEPYINDVSGLQSVKIVGDNLFIGFLDLLENFNGLRNLETIGGKLHITRNQGLLNFDGLSSLKTVTGILEISINTNLRDIKGMHFVEKAESLLFWSNNSMDNILFLDQLSQIDKDVSISGNASLTSINLFNEAVNLDNVVITQNAKLLSIGGFNNLTSLSGALSIRSNVELLTIEGFQKLELVNNNFNISENRILQKIPEFNALKKVNQNFFISKNYGLAEITGFANLESIYRGMEIWWNSDLKKIEAFDNLISIGYQLRIQFNEKLNTIRGFNSFQGAFYTDGSPGRLDIVENNLLEELTGFNSATNFPGLINISGNNEIEIFDCFQLLESAGSIVLRNTKTLENLTSFSQLKNVTNLSITKNHGLKNINSLSNLTEIEGLVLSENEQLTDFCGLQGLFDNGWNGNLTINLNAYNPTSQDLIAGSCSQ